MKKFLALLLVMVMCVAAGIGGTVAYLTDTEEAVNVMTVGNVSIKQIEQQRVNYTDKQNELEDFEQNKMARPCYYEGTSIPWAPEDQWVVAGDQAWKVVEDNDNVIDKFVTVENTGNTGAFVRTIIAFEVGKDAINNDYMHLVYNGTNITDGRITWEYAWLTENGEEVIVELNGNYYFICTATYNGVLEAGKTTIPNIKQVYLDKTATNENVAAYGETFEILVLSQAVQSDMNGLTNVEALNEAFGEVNAANAKAWFEGVLENPYAKVTVLNAGDVIKNAEGDATVLDKNLTIDTEDSKMGFDLGKLSLDTAYQFEPKMSADEVKDSEYKTWHADFVVSVDKDIPAYGIGLAGYYDAWCSLNNDKWVMLASSDPITAGTELRLVDAMGGGSITVSYKDLCDYGNDGIGFLCGAVALEGKEIDGKIVEAIPAGTTITVELRLYEATDGSRDSESGEYITTGIYRYTFK